MPTGPRPIGDFCWINVLTPDPDAARTYFADLLGWTYVELPGMGHLAQVDGHDIGGVWDLASPNTPPGTPPGIGVMVRVEDADAISARAAPLGGTGKPAFDVGPTGRMAEVADPVGGAIDVWQPGTSPGMTADSSRHGVPSWIECLSHDTARASTFYRDLFGWTAETMPMPGMDYTVFANAGAPVAGMMAITSEMGEMPSVWLAYVTVDDVDATVARSAELGGNVFLPAQDVPTVGRMAGLISPQGVMFHVIRYEARAGDGGSQ